MEAVGGAQDVTCLEPFGIFFFFFFGFILFYYANEIPSLHPPPAAPRHITTQKGHQSPLACP